MRFLLGTRPHKGARTQNKTCSSGSPGRPRGGRCPGREPWRHRWTPCPLEFACRACRPGSQTLWGCGCPGQPSSLGVRGPSKCRESHLSLFLAGLPASFQFQFTLKLRLEIVACAHAPDGVQVGPAHEHGEASGDNQVWASAGRSQQFGRKSLRHIRLKARGMLRGVLLFIVCEEWLGTL